MKIHKIKKLYDLFSDNYNTLTPNYLYSQK